MKDDAKYTMATLDIETDPFLYGREPAPFACEIYCPKWGGTYQWWGDDCIEQMVEFIRDVDEPLRIYAHNGGGFDFWFLQHWIENPVFFIHSKIAKCGFLGKHELRDSYKLIPVKLAAYQKDEIDYKIFEADVRDKPKNKQEILHYLHTDCVYLYEMIERFTSEYGNHLTQAGAAFSKLKELHPHNHMTELYDERFRPFYYGGRNECFAGGECKGDWKIYDVNSMYPYVMKHCQHPRNGQYSYRAKLDPNKVSFVQCRVKSDGALPVPTKYGLTFPYGEFDANVCSHELIMGLELGLIKILKVYNAYQFHDNQNFGLFVDKYSKLKIEASEKGDKGGRLFAKLLLNSAYGKEGQNPRNYRDCQLFDTITECREAGFIPAKLYDDMIVGAKPAEIKPYSYNDVAIAASITSAARAHLMKGLSRAKNPIYCDTDSIICESLDMELHPTKLGAWDLEGEADTVYIAGKKLYACYNSHEPTGKKASKGVNLTSDDIRDIAMGQAKDVPIDAPALRFAQKPKWIKRKIQKTVD